MSPHEQEPGKQRTDTPDREPLRLGRNILVGGFALCLTGVVIAATAAVQFAADASNAYTAMKVETNASVVDPGKAEIMSVDMTMPPITLATAETKVTGVKTAFEQKLTGFFDISLGSNTVTREANVETQITIDPGKVAISYDSDKKQLTFSAPNTALSTKVDIPTGEARTTDKTGSLVTLPAEWITKVSEAIDGTFGTDNSKVPIINSIADGTLAINEGLEQYADLTIVTQVDQECTPLIPKVADDFNGELQSNIAKAVKGQLLDPSVTNKVSMALKDLPLSEVQKLVDSAIVKIPENLTIGPDPKNIAKLQAYKDSKFFTTTLDNAAPIACGISSDATLKPVDKGGSNG